MAFGNPLLLLAALGAAVPIVLHLIMRQKPKRLTFPALQFVAQRQNTNRRRMQLRQWVLLALRCLAVALAALALARPSVASAQLGRWLMTAALAAAAAVIAGLAVWSRARLTGPWVTWSLAAAAAVMAVGALTASVAAALGEGPVIGDQEAPVAAVLVLDTSPRMAYLQAGRSRLAESQELALRLIRELPPDSQIAVLDSRRAGAFFSADRAAARTAVERAAVHAVAFPLSDVLLDAAELAASSDLTRREVYLFSDLARSAWPASSALRERLAAHSDLLLYAFDVGVADPENASLGELRLSSATIGRGGECVVSAEVRSLNATGEVNVRLELEEYDPTLPEIRDGQVRLPPAAPRGRAAVRLQPGQAQTVELRMKVERAGIRHGRLLLEADDALLIDNVRHFALQVRDAWPVLLVHGRDASPEFLRAALSPEEYQDFQCTVLPQLELDAYDLTPFAAICLLDPQPLTDAMWLRLEQYVRGGGGLWIQLGRQAEASESFNGAAAQRLLPGPLVRRWRAGGRELFFDLRDSSHPALRLLRQQSTTIRWSEWPVFRHWVVDPLDAEARVLIGYSDNRFPALLEKPLGAGRLVVSTTPFSDVFDNGAAWNALAFGENNWPVFVLVNELLTTLVQEGGQRLNYLVGETVSLTNDERTEPLRYQLFSPAEPPQDLASRDGQLSIGYTDSAGAYRLKGNRDGPRLKGFACNLPESATDLERIDKRQLDEVLGDDRCQLASNWDELERVQGRQRVGREFFPLLMALLAAALGLEHLLANRFYGESARRAPGAQGVKGAKGAKGAKDAKGARGTASGGGPRAAEPSRRESRSAESSA